MTETIEQVIPISTNSKFMLTLRTTTFNRLNEIALKRGITLQELLRAIIIPEYIKRESLFQ